MSAWRRILGVLRHTEPAEPLSDAELLARFAASRDQAAFEVLVWRHAAMVFGVCRRAVRDEHLAEDAFQAVFVVLTRKAEAVRGSNLAGWLFRVARRVGGRAAKRTPVVTGPVPERAVDSVPDPVERDELRSILDAEIARLPDRLQRPVILCYLGGHSTDDAARQLGVPRGTVLSRLSTARARLAARLTIRGIVPAVVVAPSLVGGAVRAALAPLPRSHAVLLAEGVIRTMTLTKSVPVAAAFLVAAGLMAGIGSTSGPGRGATAYAQPPAKAVANVVTVRLERASTYAQPPAKAKSPLREEEEELRSLATKLVKMRDTLRDQIDRDTVVAARFAAQNGIADARGLARLERQLTLVDADIFAAEKDMLEHQVRRRALEVRASQSVQVLPENDVQARVNADKRVAPVLAEVVALEKQLIAKPTDKDLQEKVNAKVREFEAATAKVQPEVRKVMVTEARSDYLARITADLNEKQLITEGMLVGHKRLRAELEEQLVRRTAAAADHQRMLDALKPKLDMLHKLELRLLTLDLPDGPTAPAGGVEAKLDALIREVEGLRQDVRELKKR